MAAPTQAALDLPEASDPATDGTDGGGADVGDATDDDKRERRVVTGASPSPHIATATGAHRCLDEATCAICAPALTEALARALMAIPGRHLADFLTTVFLTTPVLRNHIREVRERLELVPDDDNHCPF